MAKCWLVRFAPGRMVYPPLSGNPRAVSELRQHIAKAQHAGGRVPLICRCGHSASLRERPTCVGSINVSPRLSGWLRIHASHVVVDLSFMHAGGREDSSPRSPHVVLLVRHLIRLAARLCSGRLPCSHDRPRTRGFPFSFRLARLTVTAYPRSSGGSVLRSSGWYGENVTRPGPFGHSSGRSIGNGINKARSRATFFPTRCRQRQDWKQFRSLHALLLVLDSPQVSNL